nr:hemolysin [Phenylobacterium sp.]
MSLVGPTKPPRHYPTPAAKCADLVVHIVGLTLALIGGIVLLALAVRAGSITRVLGVSIYAAGLLAMLAFSTAYNFAKARYRPTLR